MVEAQHRLAEEPARVALDQLAPPERLQARVQISGIAGQQLGHRAARELTADDCCPL